MKKRIASLTSNTLNPFLISLVLMSLLAIESAPSTRDAVKWMLISIAISVVPILAVILYLVRNHKLEGLFINIREQRTKIYVLAGICTGIGSIVIPSLGAPPILSAVFITGFATVVIFMFINLFWKISIHTAFITASATLLIVLYGAIAAVSTIFIPLMAWSRVELKHHSLAQVISGAFLAALIMVTVFYFSGIVLQK